jgi:O-antigen ligase
MLFLLILIGVLLILFNLFIWLYDEQKIKLSILKSLKLFKNLSIMFLGLYLLMAMYVYLFIPNTFK